jgi:hypothetical protein
MLPLQHIEEAVANFELMKAAKCSCSCSHEKDPTNRLVCVWCGKDQTSTRVCVCVCVCMCVV